MAWRLALAMLLAIPFLAGAFWALTGAMVPLLGYGLGLCLYWSLLAGLILWSGDLPRLLGMADVRSPGPAIGAMLVLPVVATGAVAMSTLGQVAVPTAVLLLAALAALVNATLEEAFWRGALIPAPDREAVIVATALFAAWHVALVFARDVAVPGGPALLLIGAAALGAVWMAARLRTGALGAGVMSHFGVNLFGFAELAARNLG